MIPRTLPHWQHLLAGGITSSDELTGLLNLPPGSAGEASAAKQAQREFPLRVPRGFVERMVPGDAEDPLLRQVLATAHETVLEPGFSSDPVGEAHVAPAPGLLHKYHGRVLLVVTGACAIHCRYCFRRHFPYGEHHPGREGWSEALAYISSRTEVEEVILSGGDPLAASDQRLADLTQAIAAIPHVRRLRVHTRMPIVLPERINDDLLAWLTATRLEPVVVVHCNHAREINESVRAALGRLRERAIPVLNQAVLLRGINDTVEALAELNRTLFTAGVLPYYLHLLDPVQGAAHFEVPAATARRLVQRLSELLPGYLLPRLVCEVEGAPAKLPVTPHASI